MMNGRSSTLRLFLVVLNVSVLFSYLCRAEGSAEVHILAAKEITRLIYDQTSEITFTQKGDKGLCYFNPNGEYMQLKDNWLVKGNWIVSKQDRLCITTGNKDEKCRMLILNKAGGVDQYIAKKNGDHKLELTYDSFKVGNKIVDLAASQEPPFEKLKKEEIIQLFAGNTVESKTVRKGRESLIYYAPDGTLELSRNGRLYSGVWRVTDEDKMCLKIMDSKEKCRIIVKQGETYSKFIVKKNGQHQQSIGYHRFLPGKQF